MLYTNYEIRDYAGIGLKKINGIARVHKLGGPVGKYTVFSEQEFKKIMNVSGYSFSIKKDSWVKKS